MDNSASQSAKDEDQNRYLVFKVGGEAYATPLLGVGEVAPPLICKAVPNSEPCFLGLANLRGRIAGVIDLRIRFGVPAVTTAGSACLVFDTDVGLLATLVDEIDSVETIPEETIDRRPTVSTKIPADYLVGVAVREERLLAVIDLHQLLSREEIVRIHSHKEAA
jgi:purine-binding chemotaxis protein CheW